VDKVDSHPDNQAVIFWEKLKLWVNKRVKVVDW